MWASSESAIGDFLHSIWLTHSSKRVNHIEKATRMLFANATKCFFCLHTLFLSSGEFLNTDCWKNIWMLPVRQEHFPFGEKNLGHYTFVKVTDKLLLTRKLWLLKHSEKIWNSKSIWTFLSILFSKSILAEFCVLINAVHLFTYVLQCKVKA